MIVPLDFLLKEMEVKIVKLPNGGIAKRKVSLLIDEGGTYHDSSDESCQQKQDHDFGGKIRTCGEILCQKSKMNRKGQVGKKLLDLFVLLGEILTK